MLMQCYDINIDSSIGLNYVLFIPDTDDFQKSFYSDHILSIEPSKILDIYSIGHTKMDVIRKDKKLKPKSASELLEVIDHDTKVEFRFTHRLETDDGLITIDQNSYWTNRHITTANLELENCVKTFDDLIDRTPLEPEYGELVIEKNSQLYKDIMDHPDLWFQHIQVGNHDVKIPLYRSIFMVTAFDTVIVHVIETSIKEVYLITLEMNSVVNGVPIKEAQFGYVQNF